MKIRPLPELDLARIAPMTGTQKYQQLQKMKFGRPPYTYNPVRLKILDIFNAVAGPLAPSTVRTPFQTIAADIRRSKESEDGIKANCQVAEGLYDFAVAQNIRGRQQQFLALPLAMGVKVTYWSPVVIELYGRPTVPFIDPRRTLGLTSSARQFTFSVMHERIRAANPDFSAVSLAILQFEKTESGPRLVIVHFDDNIELLSVEALDNMMRETYEIWNEVLAERERDARRGNGSSGSLL